MKRTLKKIVALVTVLSMLLLTVPTFAHSGSVGVTDIQKTMKGYSSPSNPHIRFYTWVQLCQLKR